MTKQVVLIRHEWENKEWLICPYCNSAPLEYPYQAHGDHPDPVTVIRGHLVGIPDLHFLACQNAHEWPLQIPWTRVEMDSEKEVTHGIWDRS
jgi:hypothetical protein